MNIGLIIQVRVGSSRLPSKVFKKIGHKTTIKLLIDRLEPLKKILNIVLATSDNHQDNKLEEFAKKNKLEFYRGPLEDVLERFYLCSKKYNFDVIIRVTADDPFKDPEVILKALTIFRNNNYDYVSNTIKPTYPEGIDIEIFSFRALEIAHREAKLDSERLHVTPYIWKNNDRFNIHNFEDLNDNSQIRLTCDYKEDLDYLNKIYKYFDDDNFSYTDIIEIIKEKNIKHARHIDRNEGYLKDVSKEK